MHCKSSHGVDALGKVIAVAVAAVAVAAVAAVRRRCRRSIQLGARWGGKDWAKAPRNGAGFGEAEHGGAGCGECVDPEPNWTRRDGFVLVPRPRRDPTPAV